MTVFSKALVLGAAALSGVDAVKKARGSDSALWNAFKLPLKTATTFMAAGAAATSSHALREQDSAQELSLKFVNTQDELESIINDKEKMKTRFDEFMHKKYCSGGPCTIDFKSKGEDEPKYQAFVLNVNKAHERNLNGKGNVVHGITSLMDLSSDEFMKLMGYKVPEGHMRGLIPSDVVKGGDAPDANSRDWRKEGAVTPVKDQGQCGSCWAFSTVESIESAALVQQLASKEDPFIGAPQELVSCDNGSDEGCNGGLPANAFKFLMTHPLEPEQDYPYTSGTTERDGKCKLDKSEGVFEVDKATQVSIWGIGENQDMQQWLTSKGPLSVAVHANHAWQTYKYGVMDYDECPDDLPPNHAVQAVALNVDADKPYWVIRNSWNADWGEEGFIRITYNKNTCNVAYEAYGVEVKRKDEDSVTV